MNERVKKEVAADLITAGYPPDEAEALADYVGVIIERELKLQTLPTNI